MKRKSPVLRPIVAAICALAVMACGTTASCAPAGPPPLFYDAPPSLAGAPGSLIRFETVGGAPQGASAYRVLYRSLDAQGRVIPVSGLIVVPRGAPPPGGRPIVAWAHPTTGVVPDCAPSRSLLRYMMTAGLAEFLRRGYVVAATDYPGTGAGEVQPFLDGPAEARAVLDSVRAARALPDAAAGPRFALWGHSQGGQAVLFASTQAGRYAPELSLVGTAAAAPATDLGALMRADLGTDGGNNLTAYALWSWANVYGASYDGIVRPEARPAVAAIAQTCVDTLIPSRAKRDADQVLSQGFLTVPDITRVQPWQGLMSSNSAGTLPPGIPVYLTQGTADVVVRPQITDDYMRRLCRAGSRVTFEAMPHVGHGMIAMRSAPAVAQWISDRFNGVSPDSDCASVAAPVASSGQ